MLGFQIVAASAGAKTFDIVLNSKHGGNSQRNTLSQISAKDAIPFSLALSADGKATLIIGTSRFEAELVPIQESKAMVFCSTAQIKFTGLAFSSNTIESGVGQ